MELTLKLNMNLFIEENSQFPYYLLKNIFLLYIPSIYSMPRIGPSTKMMNLHE